MTFGKLGAPRKASTGTPMGASNNDRVIINTNNISYLNLAKTFGFSTTLDPTTVSSDGYPITTPASNILANPTMPAGYYGTFTWSWSGTAGMQYSGNPPTVFTSISPQGAVFEAGNVTSGDIGPGNLTVCSQTPANNVANPSIVFAFGWNIQSISNGGGLIRINTKVNFVASGSGYNITNNTVNITGANANTGANGTWVITNLTASSFDLAGSTFTNAQAGVGGQAIFATNNMSLIIRNSGTFSGFANLVWCKTSDAAAIASGQIIGADYISEMKYLLNQTGTNASPAGWLRFMDASSVQQSFEGDFSQRIPSSYITYGVANVRPGYWTTSGSGAITNTADAYTCGDPTVSVWSGSAYFDNAIVQGIPSATNTGGSPTLNVGGHGAKPIFNYDDTSAPFTIVVSAGASSPGTDVLQFTFTQNSWTNPQLNGGSPYVFSYTTVAGDGNAVTLQNNLQAALSGNATLTAAKIFFENRQQGNGPFVIPRTAQAGRMTLAYTSGTATIAIINCRKTAITAGSVGTFIYNYLLDGWIYKSGGAIMSIPLEAIVDMCNRVNAHCWFNIGFTKGAFVTAVTQFFGDSVTGLTNGLKLGIEAWNEVWNSGANPYGNLITQGQCLGWSENSFEANYSLTGLRTKQYAALAIPAWTGKGRNASHLYPLFMAQLGETQNGIFDASMLKGTSLVTTNATYANYGALNGTGAATANYNAFPNRPIDCSTVAAIGQAPYWNSKYLGQFSFTQAGDVTGSTAQNLSTLVAAHDFATGNVTSAFLALVNQFNRVGTVGPGGGLDFVNMQTFFTNHETMAAQYDAARTGAGMSKVAIMHYEGGPAFGIGANGNNGVNSLTFNTVLSGDITALANQMTALGWNVSTWTVSATDNKTEMATMVLQMLQAWKFDVDNNGVAFNSGSYKNMIKTSYFQALKTTSGANRETKACQYGVAGSNWGFWPVSISDPSPYQNRLAIHEWNAGT